MQREDYILRLIREFVRAIHRVSGLARIGDHTAALAAIDELLQHLIGMSLRDARTRPPADLIARLTFERPAETTYETCVFGAALFRESGALYDMIGAADEAYDCYLRALYLQLAADALPASAEAPPFAPGIDTLVAAIGVYALPTDTHLALIEHYERAGMFADAENTLFAMLDATRYHPELITLGIDLFERMLAQDDAALTAGDLSRAEVVAALNELRAYLN